MERPIFLGYGEPMQGVPKLLVDQPSSAQDAALEAGRALPEEAHC